MSKKLEQKQRRRLEEERKKEAQKRAARNRNLITLGIAVVVGALVVYLIFSETGSSGSNGASVGVAADEAGCTDIETHDAEVSRDHVDEGTKVDYDTSPPTGGNHYGNPANAGFYDSASALQPEQAVHNLEHGQVVLWYSPDAPADEIDQIESYVDSAGIGMVATPYDDIRTSYEFTLTAWRADQSCAKVSSEVIDAFRSRFQGRGPEQVGIPLFRDDTGDAATPATNHGD